MSPVAEILDRLSGVSALREKAAQQDKVIESMQRIMLEQQRELAEVKGLLRALGAKQAVKPLRPSLEEASDSSFRQPQLGGSRVSLQALPVGKLGGSGA